MVCAFVCFCWVGGNRVAAPSTECFCTVCAVSNLSTECVAGGWALDMEMNLSAP